MRNPASAAIRRLAPAAQAADAADGQPHIGHDARELIRRNSLVNFLPDFIAQARGFLDSGSGLCAHMDQDLTGIDGRKEILAEKRHEGERRHGTSQESGGKQLGTPENAREKSSARLTSADWSCSRSERAAFSVSL